MEKRFFKFKEEIKWRNEKKSLMFLHPIEKRLLIYNEKISKNISTYGIIEFNDDSEDFISFLKKIEAVDEISSPDDINNTMKSSVHVSAPLNVTIQITNKCNLKCVHCHNDKQKSFKTLAMADYRKLIDELSDLNVFNINISGGEPLLVKHIIEVVEYAIEKGMNCTMSSNLTLLNKKTAIELYRAGLRKMHVSLDSFDPKVHDKIRGVTGALEQTLENLQILRENNIQYTVVTTLVNQSPSHYERTIDLAYKLGASAHKTNTVIPQKKNKLTELNLEKNKNLYEYIEIWKNKKNQYQGVMGVLAETMFSIQIGEYLVTDIAIPEIMKVGCPAGILTCAINESGDVTPCSFFCGLVVGNVLKNKFCDIWNNEIMYNFRDRNNIIICGTCEYRDCCGGCRARAYGKLKNVKSEDSYCFLNINSNKK